MLQLLGKHIYILFNNNRAIDLELIVISKFGLTPKVATFSVNQECKNAPKSSAPL